MKSWVWQVTVLSVLLGALFAAGIRTTDSRFGLRPVTARSLEENLDLRSEILSLQKKNTAYEALISNNQSASKVLNEQLQQMKVKAGLIAVTGPGVVVTIDDSREQPPAGLEADYIVHDSDLRTVVNELCIAGAEAVSINGQRIVATTGIRCPGPVTEINGVPTSPPYQIKAIGDPQTLQSALEVHGGVMDEYRPYLQIRADRAAELVVEAYSGSTQFRFAKPIEPTTKAEK